MPTTAERIINRNFGADENDFVVKSHEEMLLLYVVKSLAGDARLVCTCPPQPADKLHDPPIAGRGGCPRCMVDWAMHEVVAPMRNRKPEDGSPIHLHIDKAA